jgi:hypothetical protein
MLRPACHQFLLFGSDGMEYFRTDCATLHNNAASVTFHIEQKRQHFVPLSVTKPGVIC